MSLTPGDLTPRLRGVQCAMVTPFRPDGSLDEQAFREHVDFLIERGVHVLTPVGTTGEFSHLTPEEHRRVIAWAVEEAAGRVPVIAGACALSTRMTIELCRAAQDLGADGVLVAPPLYLPPSEDDIQRHYEAVNEAVEIGIMLYHFPNLHGVSFSPELCARLAALSGVVAIKETSLDPGAFEQLIAAAGDRMVFFSGGGEFLAPFAYRAGGVGMTSSLANVAPRLSAQMHVHCVEGEYDEAMQLVGLIAPFWRLCIDSDIPTITLLKEAMRLAGRDGGVVRAPLPQGLANDVRRRLEQSLRGII